MTTGTPSGWVILYKFSLQTNKQKKQLYVVMVEPGTTQTVFNSVRIKKN